MSEPETFLSTFDPVPEEVRVPAAILTDYTPDSCLAEKGGRFVWRVCRQSDGALFILKAAPLADKDLLEEYCLLSRLSPLLPDQIPAPVDYVQDNGMEYLLRDWLPGITLAQLREREDCPPERCVQLGQKLCALLETIHSQQPPVIHRDIKPENILLLPSGEVALVDFSIARVYKDGQDTDTRHMGTRATAAPEQYGYAQTDPRTDIYALGMTLIWLLTGSYSVQALDQVPDLPLRRALEKAVSFAPENRYQDVVAFSDALAGRPPKRKQLRKPLLVSLLCILLAGLVMGAGFLWQGNGTVTFSSRTMEAAVRLELGRPEGPITYDDLAQIRHLGAVGDRVFSAGELFEYNEFNYRIGGAFHIIDGRSENGDIADLSLLAHMPNLEELYLCRQALRDVSALEGLHLTTLALNENQISDLSPIASLTELETLYLNGISAADYGPLAGLTQMRKLSLGGARSRVGEADSLAFLESLELRKLSLGWLKVRDGGWRPLSGQNALDFLELCDPTAEAMEAVRALSGLRELRLCDYALGDLTPLDGLSGLDSLVVYDLESLEGVQALSRLRELRVANSGLWDLSPLGGLNQLRSLQTSNIPNADFTTLPKNLVLDEIRLDESQMPALEAAWPDHTFHVLPP